MLTVSTHRKARNWSHAELASASGVSVPTIERIERDERSDTPTYDPRISRVVRLADALGVKLDDLVSARVHASNLSEAASPTPHGT